MSQAHRQETSPEAKRQWSLSLADAKRGRRGRPPVLVPPLASQPAMAFDPLSGSRPPRDPPTPEGPNAYRSQVNVAAVAGRPFSCRSMARDARVAEPMSMWDVSRRPSASAAESRTRFRSVPRMIPKGTRSFRRASVLPGIRCPWEFPCWAPWFRRRSSFSSPSFPADVDRTRGPGRTQTGDPIPFAFIEYGITKTC